MSASREHVLNAVRASIRQSGKPTLSPEQLTERLERPRPGLVPQRGQLDLAGRLDLFESWAKALSATLVRLDDLAHVPRAVADYLRQENLPAQVRLAPTPEIEGLDWQSQSLVEIARGRAQIDDTTSVTPAFAGIAETGTLMMLSGPQTPTTLNFVPENHIVVLKASQVVGSYEEALAHLRQVHGQGRMPRTVNYITGPSRTADIEQTIQLGAHGPRRLHILLVKDSADA